MDRALTNRRGARDGRASGLSAYRRVEVDLARRIERGEWTAGGTLPGRRELARQYAVDLKTLQRAIEPLLASGVLRADAKRGTYVGDRVARTPTGPVAGRRSAASLRLAVIAPIFDTVFADSDWNLRVLHSAERVWGELGGAEVFGVSRHVPQSTSSMSLQAAIEAALKQGSNAFLIAFADDRDERNDVLNSPLLMDLPYVFVGSEADASSTANVYYDGVDAGYQAASHLISRGYDRLMIYSPFDGPWMTDRTAGAAQAVAEADHPVSLSTPAPVISLSAQGVNQTEVANHQALKLSADDLVGLGVIAANDHAAVGFRQAAAEKGLSAGRDYGLVGYDDLFLARECRITTLRPPLEAMGEEGARLLMRSILGNRSVLQVRLRSHLIPRESSRALSPSPIPSRLA